MLIIGCQKLNTESIKVTAVTLNATSLILSEGDVADIIATVSPSNADNKKIIWSTNNPSVATIIDGSVTANMKGSATITATSDDGGKTATCQVKVNSKFIDIESISLNQTAVSLEIDETIPLSASVSPNDATEKSVSWTTSDSSVTTVNDGIITANKVGKAIISAKAGDKTATCLVEVKDELSERAFTMTSNGETGVSIQMVGNPYCIVIEYKKNDRDWAPYTIGTEIRLSDGEFLKFRAGKDGNDMFSKNEENYYKIVITGDGTIAASGDIMSLLDRKLQRKSVGVFCFGMLFRICSKLISAPLLPATNLAWYCYRSMFNSCTNLSKAPELPATTLADMCYYCMFTGCSSLESAPELPATTLAMLCYYYMFSGCSKLTSASKLPATTLAGNCYSGMYYSCSSLIKAPELPATTLAGGCYERMFSRCTNLISAPELPATSIDDYCYKEMFAECTSLTYAPELPATTLSRECYSRMFYECENLTVAPKRLPAINLAERCYERMFFKCRNLTTAPELPATVLTAECYTSMFFSCGKLNFVKMMATDITAPGCFGDMLYRVNTAGTFIKNRDATWDESIVIPSGWVVQTESE